MKIARTSLTVIAVTAALALPVVGRADHKNKAAQNVTVQFAMPQPQPAGAGVPGSPDNASTHFLLPDDVTIGKGGTVTFVVNGGGHGIAIHEVNKKTTRDDIAGDLCQGPAGTAEADRRARNAVCKAAIQNMVTVDGNTILLNGTENLNYRIKDGKGRLVIEPGFNITAGNTPGQNVPAAVIQANTNPRVDDTEHSVRLLATSGASPGDVNNPAAIATNRAGAFLTGTAYNPNVTPIVATPGNRIEVQFNRTGRFLVVCMNRGHLLNDHMFGFVNVGDDDDDN